MGRAAAHPHVDQEEPLRHPRRGRKRLGAQGEGPLLERAQLRVPQERRAVLPRQGRHPGVGRLRRRQQRAHADPAQHGRADPDRARARCGERAGLCAARGGPQFQPLGLHAPARRQDRGADGGRADQGHRRALLLRHPRRVGAARRLQERRRRAPPDRRVRPRRGRRHHRARRLHHGRRLAARCAVAEEEGGEAWRRSMWSDRSSYATVIPELRACAISGTPGVAWRVCSWRPWIPARTLPPRPG